MNKLHNGLTMVLLLGVGLLGVDRIRNSGPDRELLQRIEELRKAQLAANGDKTSAREHHEQYAVPATKSWVQQALPAKESPEENEAAPVATRQAKSPTLTIEDAQTGLERAFYAEPRDRNWGADAENTVRNALKLTLPESSQMESVNCSGSLCRIETTHSSIDDYHKYIESFTSGSNTGLWNGASFSSVIHDERGELTVVSFLAREGTHLPEVASM